MLWQGDPHTLTAVVGDAARNCTDVDASELARVRRTRLKARRHVLNATERVSFPNDRIPKNLIG